MHTHAWKGDTMRSNKPTKAEQQCAEKRAKNRVLAAAFLNVVDLLPHLRNVTSNSSIARTRYVAACPVCGEQTFSVSQGAGGVVWGRACECSDMDIANAIVERRLAAGESPEDVWRHAKIFDREDR
jgi:hypothetical protein